MLFYRAPIAFAPTGVAAIPDTCRLVIWRPARDGAPPPALASVTNRVWRAFDRLGIFASRELTVVAIMEDDRVLHRLTVTPRWFRFPFMAADELQMGDLWTDPAARGRGLARAAIHAVHAEFAARTRALWYVVDATNIASVRLIEGCGYALAGRGTRTAPFGLRALGRFVINEAVPGSR